MPDGSPPKAGIKRLGKSLFGSTGLGNGAPHSQSAAAVQCQLWPITCQASNPHCKAMASTPLPALDHMSLQGRPRAMQCTGTAATLCAINCTLAN